ncbi:MAG: hypothetical protein IT327_30330 [Anaerolineae bacterium]|nr:hypothetical protein [Anaerolineae bacterium]
MTAPDAYPGSLLNVKVILAGVDKVKFSLREFCMQFAVTGVGVRTVAALFHNPHALNLPLLLWASFCLKRFNNQPLIWIMVANFFPFHGVTSLTKP